MALKPVSVLVEENTYDFCQLLSQFVLTTADLVQKGVNLQTIPAEISAVIQDLVPALTKVSQLPLDAAESLPGFMTAIELGVNSIVAGLVGKKPVQG